MEVKGYPNYLIYNDGRVYSKYSNKFIIGGWCGLYKNATLRNIQIKVVIKTYIIEKIKKVGYIVVDI
jgi:hypothetical protein